MSMGELLKRMEGMQLQIDAKEDRRHKITKRERRHYSSSTQDESDMEIFYKESHERRRSSTNHARLDKFFRHNAKILKFDGDSNHNVYEEWERKD